MSHKHQKILNAIFKEPVSANLHWRDVESLLHHLGATTEQHGARVHAFLNNREAVLHRPHKSSTCSKTEVHSVRGFLAAAGVTPGTYQQS